MTTQARNKVLMDEIRRYLATVDAFRAEGHEPHWLAEPRAEGTDTARRRTRALSAPQIP
jgi:hypothetical protein